MKKELANKKFILKQLITYEDTKGIYHSADKQLLNTKEPQSAIQLYKTAVKALKQVNIKPSKQIKDELYRQIQSLQNQQQELYKKHKNCKKNQKQDRIIDRNLTQISTKITDMLSNRER